MVAEAMACGTPVIAHASGGPAALLGREWPLLVPYVDDEVSVSGTAEALARLAGPATSAALGERCRARALANLTWERQGERMAAVYQRAMGRAGTPS